MILNCWDSEAVKRPSFSDLVNHIVSYLVTRAEYQDFKVSKSPVDTMEENQSTVHIEEVTVHSNDL